MTILGSAMRSTTRQRVRGLSVKQDPAAPIPTEVLAASIRDIAQGMKKLLNGSLNDSALRILLHHSTGVSMREIKCVLAGLAELEKDYIRKPKT